MHAISKAFLAMILDRFRSSIQIQIQVVFSNLKLTVELAIPLHQTKNVKMNDKGHFLLNQKMIITSAIWWFSTETTYKKS